MTENSTDIELRKELKINLLIVLRNFCKLFFRFWSLTVLLSFICGALSLIYTLYTFKPVYRSESTFTVTTNTSESLNGSSYNFYYDSGTAEQLSLTFPHILSSELFTDALKAELDVNNINGSLAASVIPDSNMITMYATSPDPETSQKILEAAIKVYPDVSRFVIGKTKFNIIDPASFPNTPHNIPDYVKSVLVGCIFGALIGILPLLVIALFRHTVSKDDEIQNSVNVAYLTSLPEFKRKRRKKSDVDQPAIITYYNSPHLAEKLEALRIRVEKELTPEKKVLLVTSTLPHEGKSLISLNLAYYFAKHGKKVLLADGDLRKQTLWKAVTSEDNKNAVLAGDSIPESFASVDITDYTPNKVSFTNSNANFDFIGGKTPENEISPLLSGKLCAMVSNLKNEYDYVIIDSPPSSAFEDVLLINDYSDALLYIIKYDYAFKSKIIETLSVLKESQANIIGYVFNGAVRSSGTYGKYGYGKYGYGKYGYGYGYGEKNDD